MNPTSILYRRLRLRPDIASCTTDAHESLAARVLCGVVFGIADALMTVLGGHFDVSRSMLLEAFTSRFAIEILGVNVSLGSDRVLAGTLAGLLISLPDAFAFDS